MDAAAMGRALWIRSQHRLQYQIRVVNEFRANLDDSYNRTLNNVSPAVWNSLLTPVSTSDETDREQHVDEV